LYHRAENVNLHPPFEVHTPPAPFLSRYGSPFLHSRPAYQKQMIRWIRLTRLTHFIFALQLHERLCLVASGDFRYLSSMHPSLYDLEPGPQSPEVVRMIVEIPKNSANKYEYDGKLGVFRLDRALY
jgi:hypothetical protein